MLSHYGTTLIRFFLAVCAMVFLLTRPAMAAPGVPDSLEVSLGSGGSLSSMAIQPDGKTILVGTFTSINGTARGGVARLNADGTLDTDFDPKADNGVYCVYVQSDGKILLGGIFTSLQPNGAPAPTPRSRLARLNADGTLDTSFNPNPNSTVMAMAVQPDGRIVVGGFFSSFQPNGTGTTFVRNSIARLTSSGAVDLNFHPDPGSDENRLHYVSEILVQEDGKIVIAGPFEFLRPSTVVIERHGIARLNADGTVDPAFDLHLTRGSLQVRVFSVTPQPDGKMIVCGAFGTVQPVGADTPVGRNGIVRLNADGSVDEAFTVTADTTSRFIPQADGKLLMFGGFTGVQAGEAGTPAPRGGIARLNADGTLDGDFDPRADGSTGPVGLQPNGAILVGGSFTSFQPNAQSDPIARTGLARLQNGPAITTLKADSTTQVSWMRRGGAPLVSEVTFELSTDGGAHWNSLGAGTHVGMTPDWQLSGLSLPASGTLRARGRVGYSGGSGIIEQVAAFSTTDFTGPIGGAFDVAPAAPLVAGTELTGSFSGWTDASLPVTYEVREGLSILVPPGADTAPTFTLSAGHHTITGWVYDALGQATEAGSVEVEILLASPVHTIRYLGGSKPSAAGSRPEIPLGSLWTQFNAPAIDDSGQIAFLGKWAFGKIKGSGLFYGDTCVAVVGGDASALTGLAKAKYKTLSDPVLQGGHLACLATFSGVPASQGAAVLRYDAGGLSVVAQAGSPGTADGAKFKSFKSVAVAGNAVAFLGQLAIGTGNPKVTAASDLGVWVKEGAGPLTLVLRESGLLNSVGIKSFVGFACGAGSPGQGRGWFCAPSGNAQVLALAKTAHTQAVVYASTGALSSFASSGPVFASFGLPTTNELGHTAFLATQPTGNGVTKANARALFVDLTGTGQYQEIVRVRQLLGGGEEKFSALKDPVFAGDDGLAFPATLTGGTARGLAATTLWWRPPGGPLNLLAQGGGHPPGMPEAQWKSFPSLAIAANRGPIFTATLVPNKGGVKPATATTLWATDFHDDPHLLVQTGIPEAIVAGKTVKSFTLLNATAGSLGVTRSFNAAHQIAWLATFTDRSQAIVVTEVP